MTTDLARALWAVSLVAVLGSLACGGGGGGTKFNDRTIYIDMQKIPMELRDEYASFATNCSKCHSLSRALNAPVTDPQHWDLYVAKMMRTAGSSISPKEKPVILRFLHWYTVSYDKASSLPGEGEANDSEAPAPEPAPFPAVPEADSPPPSAPAQPAEQAPSPPSSESTPADETQTTAGEGK